MQMEKEYKDVISDICKNIHTGLIDFSLPREKGRKPIQASSEFITNKQQEDWAEDVIFRAINEFSDNIVAVRYGKSDNLVAGDDGFDTFFDNYQNELDTIGKRPDLLIFKKEDYIPEYTLDISMMPHDQIDEYVGRAIAGIEVRSSAFLLNKYTEGASKTIKENTDAVIGLRDDILTNYKDLLEQKRPELIPILEDINEISVRTINFVSRKWSSSARLSELSSKLSSIKDHLKIIQKRNTLSITPKVEDLKVVHKWISTYNVPHFYVQVFFDCIYGVSFKHILELISNPALEDDKYFVEQDTKNQNKTTIKIPSQDGICIAKRVSEPSHHSVRKELNRGRILFYISFDGGNAYLDKRNFDTLLGCDL